MLCVLDDQVGALHTRGGVAAQGQSERTALADGSGRVVGPR